MATEPIPSLQQIEQEKGATELVRLWLLIKNAGQPVYDPATYIVPVAYGPVASYHNRKYLNHLEPYPVSDIPNGVDNSLAVYLGNLATPFSHKPDPKIQSPLDRNRNVAVRSFIESDGSIITGSTTWVKDWDSEKYLHGLVHIPNDAQMFGGGGDVFEDDEYYTLLAIFQDNLRPWQNMFKLWWRVTIDAVEEVNGQIEETYNFTMRAHMGFQANGCPMPKRQRLWHRYRLNKAGVLIDRNGNPIV